MGQPTCIHTYISIHTNRKISRFPTRLQRSVTRRENEHKKNPKSSLVQSLSSLSEAKNKNGLQQQQDVSKRKNEWKAAALAVQRRKKRGMAKEKCGRDGERRAECRLWQSASGPRLVVLCKRFKVGALLTSLRLRRMSWCKLWARLRKRHQKLTHKKRQLIFLALTL